MRTYDIIVAVHHAIKAPSRDTYGPESVGLYGTAAGVSLLSTRPEGPNLAGLLPEGWGIEAKSHGGKSSKSSCPKTWRAGIT